MTSEVPVWVNGRKRWVTGLSRKTTCDDVISVLLAGEKTQDPSSYVIMEGWRRMERPLDGSSKVLKVWKAWGDAQTEVKLILRRVDEVDSGRGSPSLSSMSRRRKHHRSSRNSSFQKTIHPRRLVEQLRSENLPETIEHLMKLILAQGETIQTQIKRLKEREFEIENLEDETHRARMKTLGSNYLLETYLGTQRPLENGETHEEKGDDSGVLTEGGSDQTPSPSATTVDEELRFHPRLHCEGGVRKKEDVEKKRRKDHEEIQVEAFDETKEKEEKELTELKEKVEMWEKLVKINKKLEKEEECLVRLHIKYRKQRSEMKTLGLLCDDEMVNIEAKERLVKDLQNLDDELDNVAKEIEYGVLAISETDSMLNNRNSYLKKLMDELEVSEKESERLNNELQAVQCQEAWIGGKKLVGILKKSGCKGENTRNVVISGVVESHCADVDSNSDTGMSSLHSSGEETEFVLDTLV